MEQAERERKWALVTARAEGISICALATAIGLSPSRVHQIVADADPDALDAALVELRAARPGTEPFSSAEGCLAVSWANTPCRSDILGFKCGSGSPGPGDGQVGYASSEQGEHDIAAQPTMAAVCTMGFGEPGKVAAGNRYQWRANPG